MIRFTLIFDSFMAQTGPGTTPAQGRSFCQINMLLDYPAGFQYSVLSTTYRGYVNLDAGVSGTLGALYYFSGRMLACLLLPNYVLTICPANQQQVSTQSNYNGPVNNFFTAASNIGVTSVVWSPCGATWPLNIRTSISVSSSNPSARGLFEDDSLDTSIEYVTGVSWRRC